MLTWLEEFFLEMSAFLIVNMTTRLPYVFTDSRCREVQAGTVVLRSQHARLLVFEMAKSKNVNSFFEVSISTFIALIFPLFLWNLSSLENSIAMNVQFFLAYATHSHFFMKQNCEHVQCGYLRADF
jgi:hypothetical protein